MIDKIIELDRDLFIYLNKSESVTDFFGFLLQIGLVMFVMLLSLNYIFII